MTTEQFRDQEEIVRTMACRIRAKYCRGQAEHGGNLWERPALPELVNETTDLNTYLVTLERQLRGMHAHVKATIMAVEEGNKEATLDGLRTLDAFFHSQLPS